MIVWDIQRHDHLSSTQDHLKSIAASEGGEGLCVQALEQSAGHGRHGRVWNSPKGNLYLSFFLKPDCDVAKIGELSLLTSVAIAQSIEVLVSAPSMLKWPNDVLAQDSQGKFHKCAGILVESVPQDNAVIVGLGVNTQSAPSEGVALDIDTEQFRDRFLSIFAALYQDWQMHGFEQGRVLWLSYAHKIGASVSVKVGSDIRAGTFAGLSDHGTLLLQGADGTITPITSGEIYVTGD
jgi:BirA family biotin operon repressor/biotin-[acetyl-CoA-carboxylase] ligase